MDLGTIRRFMEQFPDGFQSIVFCFDSIDELEVYQHILPLYFPRTLAEKRRSIQELPQDIGNEYEEPIVEDRKIPIQATVEPERSPSGTFDVAEFTTMSSDPDKERLKKIHGADQVNYITCLGRSRDSDLDHIAALDLIYHAGVDLTGDTVIAFLPERLPTDNRFMKDVTMYIISVMDSLVNYPYSVRTGSRMEIVFG